MHAVPYGTGKIFFQNGMSLYMYLVCCTNVYQFKLPKFSNLGSIERKITKRLHSVKSLFPHVGETHKGK